MKKITRHPLVQNVLLILIGGYARLVFATARVRVVNAPPAALQTSSAVFALWHQQITHTPALAQATSRPLLALMSGSRDGQAIRQLAHIFGIGAAVGSSHRGALSGTRNLLRAARDGKNILITPDGPRGPACKAKPGAIEIARFTRLPLVPVALWSTHGATFGSWDALRLPFPFTRIHIAFGEPLHNATPRDLEQALNTLTAQARAAARTLAESRTTH